MINLLKNDKYSIIAKISITNIYVENNVSV